MKLQVVLSCFFTIIIILISFVKANTCLIDENMDDITASYAKHNGNIVAMHSRWNEKGTEIETVLSVKIDSSIDDYGKILHVVSSGGILPEEGIALIVTGSSQFALGDQVTVFDTKSLRYAVKKHTQDYPLAENIFNNYQNGFTRYCYDDSTLELSCGEDSCGSGVYWPKDNLPVTYYIHSSFSSNQNRAITAAMETWNNVNTMFQGLYGGITEVNEVAPDGMNIIRFAVDGELPDNQLASCHIWTDLAGQIFDADISLNPLYVWGTNGSLAACDIQNILTHEIGHLIGLGDIYNPGEIFYTACMGKSNRENTMYAFSGRGEIKKRTLRLEDVFGVQSLYGCAVTIALEGDEKALESIRNFVDSFLSRTAWGNSLINLYYEMSPQLSAIFLTHPQMKLYTDKVVRKIIPVLEMLSSFQENPHK